MPYPKAAAPLIGIARLASESPLLEEKKQVEYFELPTRRFLTKCSSPRMPFTWTLNPYRGCEYGCKYCYARYAHEFMELRDGLQFERMIYAKQWDEQEFRNELRRVKSQEAICIGTATDPYQPAERRYGITRKMLTVIAGQRGNRIWITTKSDLVTRDLDLLLKIRDSNDVQVSLTVTTVDESLARQLEPMAPRPYLRLAAVRKLSAAGIRSGVLAHPILPLLNDSERSMDRLVAAACEAGAAYFSAAVVFLKPCAQAVFFPFLETHYPHLLRRYKERFEKNAYMKGDYPKMIKDRLERLRTKHGMPARIDDPAARLTAANVQLTLFD
jgi:DNA repair photolyase